jgi:HEAT repeat protein
MAVDIEKVKAALNPEEPNYPKAATELGPDALPHLEKIIGGSDTLLASKATYLAGVIGGDKSLSAVEKAARSSEAVVRIAAAAAAAHLSAEQSDTVLMQLVDDADAGVQKVAIQAAPETMSDRLRSRVNALRKSAASPKTKARKTKRRK